MLSSDRSVMRSFVAATMEEVRLSPGLDNEVGVKERVASSFSEITRSEARRVRFGMGMLATIGATAPFVGLFGTVWGIMNSFIGISRLQTTNLAVVAPAWPKGFLRRPSVYTRPFRSHDLRSLFTRHKGYLGLVGRAAGTVTRQLRRELDRMHATSAPSRGVVIGRYLHGDVDDEEDFDETTKSTSRHFDVLLVLLIVFMVAAPL